MSVLGGGAVNAASVKDNSAPETLGWCCKNGKVYHTAKSTCPAKAPFSTDRATVRVQLSGTPLPSLLGVNLRKGIRGTVEEVIWEREWAPSSAPTPDSFGRISFNVTLPRGEHVPTGTTFYFLAWGKDASGIHIKAYSENYIVSELPPARATP